MPSGERTKKPPNSSSSATAKKLCPSFSWPAGNLRSTFSVFSLSVQRNLRVESIHGSRGEVGEVDCFQEASAWARGVGRSEIHDPGKVN